MKRFIFPLLVMSALNTAATGDAAAQSPPASQTALPHPPLTPVQPVVETLHGVSITDEYRWLEDGESGETQAWTVAQNKFTRSYLDAVPNRAEMRSKLETLIQAGSVALNKVIGNRVFFTRREGSQNQGVVYFRDGNGEAKVALNPNEFSADGTVALDWMYPSKDGKLLAYGASKNGDEISTLRVRDIATGKDLPDAIPYTRAASVAWLKDNSGFYYSRFPKPGSVAAGDEKYYKRIYFHALGANPDTDALVFGDGIAKEDWLSVDLSSDERYLVVSAFQGWSKSELYVKDLQAKPSAFVPVIKGIEAGFFGTVYNGTLYLKTNYKAARGRIIAIDLSGEFKNIGEANWREAVSEQPAALNGFSIFSGKIVADYLEDASSRLRVLSLQGKLEKEITLPTLGTVSNIEGDENPLPSSNASSSANYFVYGFSSYFTPTALYRYEFLTGNSIVIETVKTPVDATLYETKQVFYPSKDGTKIPMFLVSRKGIVKNGDNPVLLYGYGGFNNSLTPAFSAAIPVWLDAGGVYAIANLRGGGEYGEAWHRAGMLEQKQNTFDDFIAAAEYLVREKITRVEKLAIQGGSNGGLLVGAAVTQRPDLFRAAVCGVPLLDMVRYHRFQIARLWIPEYGSSENKEQFEFIYKYSPYHRVQRSAYPATLFTTAESDTRVDPLHARKMAALMQAKNISKYPVLIRIESKAGHGAGKPVTKIIDEILDRFSFLMRELGMTKSL